MSVPARPSAGGVVESGWGQVVHDAAVAQDIQAGTVTVAATGAPKGSTHVTFARPFAAAPAVLVTQNANASGWFTATGPVTPAGFDASIFQRDGGDGTTSFVVSWLAIGPRA